MGTLISGFQEAMMPRGPKGEKHPADVIGNAVHVMRIATGEEPEDFGPETLPAAILGCYINFPR